MPSIRKIAVSTLSGAFVRSRPIYMVFKFGGFRFYFYFYFGFYKSTESGWLDQLSNFDLWQGVVYVMRVTLEMGK